MSRKVQLLATAGSMLGGLGFFTYQLRTGYFGKAKFVLHDDKQTEFSPSLTRGWFQDKLVVFESDRTDWWIFQQFHDDERDMFSHLVWAKMTKFTSFKPIEFDHVYYEKHAQLDQALSVELVRSVAENKSEAEVRADLKKVIQKF